MGSNKRKANLNIDSTKPKGKITAYAYFIRYKHEQKDSELANLPFSEFSKKCSNEWKDMDDSGRAPFIKMASDDRVRFNEEMKVWTQNGGKARAEKRAKRDINEPKRPKTAFFIFSSKHREKIKQEHPEYKVTDVARELGKLWRDASEETKKQFEELSQAGKDEYAEAIKVYRAEKKIKDTREKEEEKQRAAEELKMKKAAEKQALQEQKEEQQRQKKAQKLAEQQAKMMARQQKKDEKLALKQAKADAKLRKQNA